MIVSKEMVSINECMFQIYEELIKAYEEEFPPLPFRILKYPPTATAPPPTAPSTLTVKDVLQLFYWLSDKKTICMVLCPTH